MESYAKGHDGTPLLEETIGANLERTVARWPDGEAMVELASGRRWSWREFNETVDAVSRGFLAMGLKRGDRLGMWAPNSAEWTFVQYASAKVGVILVNVNPAYRTHELAYVINQSGMKALVTVESFKSSAYRTMIEELLATGEVPTLTDVVYADGPDWASLIGAGESVAAQALAQRSSELTPDDPINIQYTSGTTGFPKGATLSHRNILNNGYFVTEAIRFTEHDRLCIPVPFYHCFGMVMANLGCTTHGSTMVIPGPAFDPATTLRAVEQERCTALYGVPTMFIAMQELDDFADYDLATLRTGIMAGSTCPVEVMRACIDDMHLGEMSIAYGMTETSPVSCQTRVEDDLELRTATIGRVHPHLEVKVIDPVSGEIVPRGEPGEYCTRGYSVMKGYWQEPEKTSEAIDADGWMHSGDLAVMRPDGYCTIVGRMKDMVIRGGENIYPREIEEFLHTHPDVVDVQVVGVRDEKYGEELCAWVRLREGAELLDATGVREFAHGRLAHYKIPRYVIVVDEFPMTVTGKIRKVEMREQSLALLGIRS